MKKNIGNRKSEKSKSMIRNSLLNILKEKSIDKITIQEIVDDAMLSRRTFYRNYDSKEEVIMDILFKIWREYITALSLEKDLSFPNICGVLFRICEKNFNTLKILCDNKLLNAYLYRVIEDFPKQYIALRGNIVETNEQYFKYSVLFNIGGFISIIHHWINDTPRLKSEEMILVMENILNNLDS